MTRENSVWRLPLHSDGTTSKVGRFCEHDVASPNLTLVTSFGIAGPDGLTLDAEGNLFICHPSLLSIFVVTRHGVPFARIVPPEGHGTSLTNCIFGSTPLDRTRLYFTDSTVGRICFVDWHCEGATPVRASRSL
jgi:sugar lactone lactonase YvrE